MLFQRVPDAVIGPRLGKVIAPAFRCALFIGDNLVEHDRGAVNHTVISHTLFDHQNPRAMGENMGPFLHQGLTTGWVHGCRIHLRAVIDGNVAHHRACQGRIGGVGGLRNDLAESFKIATVGV